MKNAVWYELLPYDALKRPGVLRALAVRDVAIYLAVTPPQRAELPDAIARCRDAGLEVGVWPMLDRAEGRWPSLHNAERFVGYTASILEELDGTARLPDVLAIDLEPPIDDLRRLMALDRHAIRRRLRDSVALQGLVSPLTQLAHRVGERGIDTISAAFPLVLADGPGAGWQRFLGTPIDHTPTSRVSTMLYTSLFEGYARGRLSRRDVVSLLAVSAAAAHRRFGARASISVGAVDTGALGDEPVYRTPQELAEDVGVVRAAGIEHLVLFSLCGALRRPPFERWLDALVETEPAQPPRITPRAATTALALLAGGRAMHWGRRIWRAMP